MTELLVVKIKKYLFRLPIPYLLLLLNETQIEKIETTGICKTSDVYYDRDINGQFHAGNDFRVG